MLTPILLKRKLGAPNSSSSSPLVSQSSTFDSFPPSVPYSSPAAATSMPNFHVNSANHTKKESVSSSILSQTQRSQSSGFLDQPTESILTDICTCSDCRHDIQKLASTPVSRCSSPIVEDHEEWIANTILAAVKSKSGFQWDI